MRIKQETHEKCLFIRRLMKQGEIYSALSLLKSSRKNLMFKCSPDNSIYGVIAKAVLLGYIGKIKEQGKRAVYYKLAVLPKHNIIKTPPMVAKKKKMEIVSGKSIHSCLHPDTLALNNWKLPTLIKEGLL
jgi:hypothetical protein